MSAKSAVRVVNGHFIHSGPCPHQLSSRKCTPEAVSWPQCRSTITSYQVTSSTVLLQWYRTGQAIDINVLCGKHTVKHLAMESLSQRVRNVWLLAAGCEIHLLRIALYEPGHTAGSTALRDYNCKVYPFMENKLTPIQQISTNGLDQTQIPLV